MHQTEQTADQTLKIPTIKMPRTLAKAQMHLKTADKGNHLK